MTVASDIEAVLNDTTKNDREKQTSICQIKAAALADVILNGKAAPNPIPPLINREFTLDGRVITVTGCAVINEPTSLGDMLPVLYIEMILDGVERRIRYVNPIVTPRNATGEERTDLIAAASEMLTQFRVPGS